MHILRQYKCLCYYNRTEHNIWYSWKDNRDIMIHLINYFHNLLWFNYNVVWWSSKSIFLHHSGNLCTRFKRGFIRYIIIYNHQSKLNRTSSVVITRYKYRPLTNIFLLLNYMETPWTCFGLVLETPNFCMK